jgi:HAD superfamily hydrolase (TIGR01549 family)
MTTMIKAVLLDMDNTLLANPDRAFARAFLQCFDDHMQQTLSIDGAGQLFRRVIPRLSAERPGDETNTAFTVRCLSEMTEIAAAEVEAALESFYAESYPALRDCVQPVQGAAELIQRLQAQGYAVVIATNPLYAHEAIVQRLRWAGLPVADADYALVTSADNMHFAKPDPAYYAEILGRVGIEPDEALMIGDSRRSDIRPAREVGIHTVHLDGRSLADVAADLPELLANPPHRELASFMIAPQLRGNIGALYGLLDGVQAGFWHQRPDPAEWSIIQILCHLHTSEHTTQRPRLQRIADSDNPFITAPREPGPHITPCADEGYSVARKFHAERRETLTLLARFDDTAWQRPARHSIFGLTTLLEMAYFTAQHDRLHLNQLCQTIGRCE